MDGNPWRDTSGGRQQRGSLGPSQLNAQPYLADLSSDPGDSTMSLSKVLIPNLSSESHAFSDLDFVLRGAYPLMTYAIFSDARA